MLRTISSWGKLLGLGRNEAAIEEEERRAFGRIACDIETECRATGREHGQSLPVRVKNVSRGGTCLLAPRAFRPGELLSVRLPGGTGDPPSEILGCVVRCDGAGEGRWELGCTFAQSLTHGDLLRFGLGLPDSIPDDKRGWARFPCAATATYQVVRTPEPTDWTRAGVTNISGGGIALQVEEELSVGDLLSVELSRDGAAVMTALASIVRTTAQPDGRRLVGCNFMHELPETQVARLLG